MNQMNTKDSLESIVHDLEMERIMSSLYVRLKGAHVSNAILVILVSSLQHGLCTKSPVAVNDIGDGISEDLTRI